MKYLITNVSARFSGKEGGSSVSIGGRVIRPGQSAYFDDLPSGARALEQAKMVSVKQVKSEPLRVTLPQSTADSSRTSKKRRRRKRPIEEHLPSERETEAEPDL